MSDPTDSKGNGWMQGSFTTDGKLIMLGNLFHIWNSFPENASDKPDLSVGQAGGPSGGSGYRFIGGDGSGLAVVGNRLYISLSNGNKIVAFNSIPTKIDDKPDFAIGSPDINTNTLDTNFIMSNPVPITDGKSLFVSSDCPDTDFTVKLTDVYPDGRSVFITDGILRMRNRNGQDHWEFMQPGNIYEVSVDLWSTSYIWNTGHRIRVEVSSSNYPRFLNNPNTADGIGKNTTYTIAHNVLYVDTTHPSCILLPEPILDMTKTMLTPMDIFSRRTVNMLFLQLHDNQVLSPI